MKSAMTVIKRASRMTLTLDSIIAHSTVPRRDDAEAVALLFSSSIFRDFFISRLAQV